MKLSFLTSLSFGVHSPRRCPYRALLSDHENKRFVILVLREEAQQVDGRFGKAFQRVFNRVWDKNNPFSWGDDSPVHRVVALEVAWSAIVGIDYRCPLHDDGKLVLEARHVVKRCFKTVEDARDFYSPRAANPRVSVMRSSHSAAPTPSKVSLDGRHAVRSSVSCAHLTTTLSISPRFVRPISCGAAGTPLRSVASVDARSAASVVSGGVSVSGERLPVGRSGTAGGVRSVAESVPRSASATRPSRAVVADTHGGRSAGTRTAASSAPRSSCLDYASAGEGEGGSRHRRQTADHAAQERCGVAGSDGLRATGCSAARRRLQLRAAETFACPGPGGPPVEGTATPHHRYTEASPRKARSANDLCGMDAGVSSSHADVRAGAPDAPIAEWYASAAVAAVRAGAVQRADAAGCWEYSSLGGPVCRVASRGGCGASGSGRSLGISSSVDSLKAAILQQQQQQQHRQMMNESQAQRRHGGGARAHRETQSWTQLDEVGLDRGNGGSGSGSGASGELRGGGSGVGSGPVPRASRWTQPSATYHYNTLVLSFRDPFLPQELRRFVKSDMRLLKLYESGLPPWAVFMPCYGLPYRPWLRRALWLLFIAISVFSMGCGFYDLYKNVPFLKQVITAVASRMYLPASELFEWLERHTQIRMSILLTYLFSKSPLFVSLMRMLRSLAALLQQLLQPVASALSVALQPVLTAAQAVAASVGGGAAAAAAAVWETTRPVVVAAAMWGREVCALAAAVLGPPAQALWAVAVLLAQLVRLVAALVGMLLVGPFQLACSIGGMLSWAGTEVAEQLAVAWEAVMAALQWTLSLGRAARRAAPAVKAGARLAAQAAGSGSGLSGGMAVWHWLGLEVVGAYNAVRMTFLQAFKSAQAVLNFCVTVAQTAVQHRVSLLLQLRRFITRQKERLPPAVAASVPLPAFVSMPSFSSIPAFDIPLPGPDPDEDPDEGPELVPGLAAPSAAHPDLYDLDLDMVLLGPGADERGRLASQQRPLYAGDGGVVIRRDSGSDLPDPIPIPLRGLSAGGLRRRHGQHRGRVADRLGPGGGGGQLYGMYDMSRRRLDAVDEEELEDAQQLSDPDILGAEARSVGRSAGGGAGEAYLSHSQRRGTVATGSSNHPWVSHGEYDDDDDNGNNDFLRFSSAPGSSNGVSGGGFLGDGFRSSYALRPSLSSPSRRGGQGLPAATSSLSRSVPSAGEAAGLACLNGKDFAQHNREGQQQQQKQQSRHKEQQSRQRRRSARSLGRSASSPAEGASAPATAANGNSGRADSRDRQTSCDDPVKSREGRKGPVAEAAAANVASASPECSGGPGGAGATSHDNAEDLTCSSPFVRRQRHAAKAGGSCAPSRSAASCGASGPIHSGSRDAASGGAKPGASDDDGSRNKAREGCSERTDLNNAWGKRREVGAKQVSRQPAIQAA